MALCLKLYRDLVPPTSTQRAGSSLLAPRLSGLPSGQQGTPSPRHRPHWLLLLALDASQRSAHPHPARSLNFLLCEMGTKLHFSSHNVRVQSSEQQSVDRLHSSMVAVLLGLTAPRMRNVRTGKSFETERGSVVSSV